MILSSLIFMLSSAWCYALLTKRRFENFVFPALAADVIVLYFFAIFNGLKEGFWTVISIKVILLIGTILYFAIRKKNCWNEFKEFCCTPGLLFLLCSIPIVFYIASMHNFEFWDEFYWWGRCIKTTYINDGIALVQRTFNSMHMNYPPGTQLWCYLFLKLFNMPFQDYIAFFSTNLLFIGVVVIFFRSTKWERFFQNIIIALIILIIPFFCTRGFYWSVMVDSILGIILGTIFFIYIKRKYDYLDSVIVLIYCSFLILIKQSGIMLVVFSLIYPCYLFFEENYYIYKLYKKQNVDFSIYKNKQLARLFKVSFYLLPMLSFFINISWKKTFDFYHQNEVVPQLFQARGIEISDIYRAFFYHIPDRTGDVCAAFVDAFFTTPRIRIGCISISLFSFGVFITILIILCSCFLQSKIIKNKIIVLTLILFFTFLIYAFGLMLLYFFVFPPNEGLIPGFDRYMNTFTCAFCFFAIGIYIFCYKNMKIMLLGALVICLLSPDLIRSIYAQSSVSRYDEEILRQYASNIQKSKRIFAVAQEKTGRDYWLFNYDCPEQFYFLGTVYGNSEKNGITGSSFSRQYSPKQLIEKVQDVGYLYLMKTNNSFIKNFSVLFSSLDDINNYRLFKRYKNKLVPVDIKQFCCDFQIVSFLSIKNKNLGSSFYNSRKRLQEINLLPKGKVRICPSLSINQYVKSLKMDVEMISGDTDMIVYCAEKEIARFDKTTIRNNFLELAMPNGIKMNDISFEYTNKSNSDYAKIDVKYILFEFVNNLDVSDDDIILGHGKQRFRNDDFGNFIGMPINENIEISETRINLTPYLYYSTIGDFKYKYSVTIKNIGEIPTQIYTGFAAYNDERKLLTSSNYSYTKQRNAVKVISAKAGESKITVEGNVNIASNLRIALDAAIDNSDIPNTNLLSNYIISAQLQSDGNTVIALNSPLKASVKSGSLIRICGLGGGYIYCETKLLKPGEVHVFTGTIHKDDACIDYTSKALSRGTAFVRPIILSYSQNSKAENTIQITDYNFEY